MNSATSIKRLTRTKEFRKLASISKRHTQFNLIKMLKTTVIENAWSRVLAFLFDSRLDHGLGKMALAHWVRLFKCPAALKRLAVERPAIQVVTTTEWITQEGRRLDMLIRLIDDRGEIRGVLGIENKVWADESDEQIGDYQKALVKAFPKIPKTIVFLTPNGRLPFSADTGQVRCRPFVIGYASMITLFNDLAQTAEVGNDLHRLLVSLQEYIKEEIIMPEKDCQDITRLVRELFAQPSNREAMQLIAEYLPSVRRLTESTEPAIERSIKRKFPQAGSEWRYDPRKSSNPQELKWIPADIGARTWFSRTQIGINFMLRSERPDPKIGDEYQFVVAAWCGRPSDHIKAAKFILPDWSGMLTRNLPARWEPLWVGSGYRLQDLGDKDTHGLTKLMLNGIRATYPKIRSKVFKNFPARK